MVYPKVQRTEKETWGAKRNASPAVGRKEAIASSRKREEPAEKRAATDYGTLHVFSMLAS